MTYFVFIPAVDAVALFNGNEDCQEERKIIINALETKGVILSLNNGDALVPVVYDERGPDCSKLRSIVNTRAEVSYRDSSTIFKITPPDVIDDWQFEGYYTSLDKAMYFIDGYFSTPPTIINLGSLDHDLLKIRNNEEKGDEKK